MDISFIHEIDISKNEHEKIIDLFHNCYDIYPSDVSFYHQPPHFRFLGSIDQQVIAHLSVAFRYVGWGSKFVPVYGISEFCVHRDHRKKGYAKQLLALLITKARESDIYALVSLTDSINFYMKNGFKLVHEPIKWMMMKNGETLGVLNRVIYESLVVYPITENAWQPESLDLLGPMF